MKHTKTAAKSHFAELSVLVFLSSDYDSKRLPTGRHDSQTGVDTGDENVAKAKVAEADILYEARADLVKARVAVAALRQAQVADYGNYEAAWKLARAAYYVGDHTDDDGESDDMFRQGIEAGSSGR